MCCGGYVLSRNAGWRLPCCVLPGCAGSGCNPRPCGAVVRSLRLHATSDGKVSVIPWSQGHRKKIEAVIGRSFSGTSSTPPEPALNWALGPKLTTLDDPERNQAGNFCMQLGLCLKGPVSTILAVHDEAGNVAAVALLQKLESAPLQTTCMDTARIGMKLMTLVVTGTTPRVASTPGMARRGDLCTATFAHMHKAHADCPHIYLDLLATDPSQQGKGQ